MSKQTLEQVNEQIKALRSDINKLSASLGRKIKQRDGLFLEANKDNYGSIEWLVNNPDRPGQYEALRVWIEKELGGEYNGVTASGYYPSIGQQAFGFRVVNWENEAKPEYITSIKKFVDVVLPHLKPVDEGRVGFTYATGQYSGIFEIEYSFDDKTWWTSNTVYSRKRDEQKHKSLDDALTFAVARAGQIDD